MWRSGTTALWEGISSHSTDRFRPSCLPAMNSHNKMGRGRVARIGRA
jgi:hypothetical protein